MSSSVSLTNHENNNTTAVVINNDNSNTTTTPSDSSTEETFSIKSFLFSSNHQRIRNKLLFLLVIFVYFTTAEENIFTTTVSLSMSSLLSLHHTTSNDDPTVAFTWPSLFNNQWKLLVKYYNYPPTIPLYDYSLINKTRIYSLPRSLYDINLQDTIKQQIHTSTTLPTAKIKDPPPSVNFPSNVQPRVVLLPLSFTALGSHVQCERIPVIRNMHNFHVFGDEGVDDTTSSSTVYSMPRTLIAINTCNYHKITERFLNYSEYNPNYMEIVIFDDFSKRYEELYALALQYNAVAICRNDQRLGLISMLNVAYRFFRANLRYKYMILASNDVIIPKDSTKELLRVFESYQPDITLLVPITTPLGLGSAANKAYYHLNVLNWYPEIINDFPSKSIETEPPEVNVLQEKIFQYIESRESPEKVFLDIHACTYGQTFLAFVMGFSRNIFIYEREFPNPNELDKVGYLWAPKLVTTGAEGWLVEIGVRPYIAKRSFVWHRKGSTAHDSLGAKRDNIALSCNDGED